MSRAYRRFCVLNAFGSIIMMSSKIGRIPFAPNLVHKPRERKSPRQRCRIQIERRIRKIFPNNLPVFCTDEDHHIRFWDEKNLLVLETESGMDKRISFKSGSRIWNRLLELAQKNNHQAVLIHHGQNRRLGWRDNLRRTYRNKCCSFEGYHGVSIVYFRNN